MSDELTSALEGVAELETGEHEPTDDGWKAQATLLLSLVSKSPESADLFYGIGYCLYQLSEAEECRERTRAQLKRALRIDPGHTYAALYLGNSYFDEGNYAAALDAWMSIDVSVFEHVGQHWRAAKLLEARVVAGLAINAASVPLDDLEKVESYYLALPKLDRPVPKELVSAMRRLGEQAVTSADIRMMLLRGVMFVRRAGYAELFRAELEFVERAVRTSAG